MPPGPKPVPELTRPEYARLKDRLAEAASDPVLDQNGRPIRPSRSEIERRVELKDPDIIRKLRRSRDQKARSSLYGRLLGEDLDRLPTSKFEHVRKILVEDGHDELYLKCDVRRLRKLLTSLEQNGSDPFLRADELGALARAFFKAGLIPFSLIDPKVREREERRGQSRLGDGWE